MKSEAFDKLVAIVAKHYHESPERVISKIHRQGVTAPRNVVAAIWSRGATLSDTAAMIGWKSPQQVCHARSRVQVLSQNPVHAYRLRAIVAELEEVMPWLVLEDANPQKDATDEEQGAGENT